ncbi:MAG: hypothetical protein GEU86_10435 [Actinophytocola sp.]|nr:hypothetical protein [Actinophytocola sp.]
MTAGASDHRHETSFWEDPLTYPPQDPYGGQPPSGGFPQQGGYPPSGYPPPGGAYPYPGGFGPQPPKKSNTGLIVGVVAAVVVLLAALGITGFWQPGFFLSSAESSEKQDDNGAEAVAKAIVAGLKSKDTAALNNLKCPGATDQVGNAINAVNALENAELVGPVTTASDTEASAQVKITISGGQTDTVTGTLAKGGDKWCWQDLKFGSGGTATATAEAPAPAPDEPTADAPAPPPGGSDSSAGNGAIAKRTMEDFLAKVADGDKSGAESMMCPDAQKIGFERAMEGKAKLKLTQEPRDSKRITSSELEGTMNGDSASGSIYTESEDDGATWCISGFFPR